MWESKRLLLGVIGLCAALFGTGCGGRGYPQFAGEFVLVGKPQFSHESFRGALPPPDRIYITSHIKLLSTIYTSTLRLETPEGLATHVELRSLGYINQYAWPNERFNGMVLSFKQGSEVNPFCKADYYYVAFAEFTPSPQALEDVYIGYETFPGPDGGVLRNQSGTPVTGVKLEPTKPYIDNEKEAAWQKAVELNKGITMKLTIRRAIKSVTSACQQSEDPLLVSTTDESLVLTYQASAQSVAEYAGENPFVGALPEDGEISSQFFLKFVDPTF